MSSKKKPTLQKYCRIYQWVEAQDPDFAQAIRDLCLEGHLSPGGKKRGVTFLYPADAAYRQEIVAKTYGADGDEAARMVEALIVPDAFVEGASFSQPGRQVGNLAGVLLPVEKATSKAVHLAGGVELARCETFLPRETRQSDIAVWLVAKGRLPTEGAPYTAPRAERPPRARTGGAEGEAAAAPAPASRAALALRTADRFIECLQADRCRAHNPYLAVVVSFLNWLAAKHPERLAALRPVLDYDPVVSFYLLFEPYRTAGAGPYLVPEELLAEWGGADCCYQDGPAEFRKHFAGLTNPSLIAQVDAVRYEAANAGRDMPKRVCAAYDELRAQNAVKGFGPVLPPEAAAAYAADCCRQRRLWQDEFRHWAHTQFAAVRTAPTAAEAVAEFQQWLSAVATGYPGNDWDAERRITSPAIMSGVGVKADYTALMVFVNSTDFLYYPVAADGVGQVWGGSPAHTLEEGGIYNRNAVAERALGGTVTHRSGLSRSTLAELAVLRARGGAVDEWLD